LRAATSADETPSSFSKKKRKSAAKP